MNKTIQVIIFAVVSTALGCCSSQPVRTYQDKTPTTVSSHNVHSNTNSVETGKDFNPFITSEDAPWMVSDTEKSFVKNGVTLGELVSRFGKGWAGHGESVGILRWSFSDGSELDVHPRVYAPDEVLHVLDPTTSGFGGTSLGSQRGNTGVLAWVSEPLGTASYWWSKSSAWSIARASTQPLFKAADHNESK